MRRRLLLTAVLVGAILPFLPLLLWSFAERWFYPALFPEGWGLRAWSYLVDTAGRQIIDGLVASFTLALATTALSLLLGIPAGRALGLYDFAGKRLLSLLLLLPIIVPPLAVAMGLHRWFLQLGLAETFFGVVLIHLSVCLPYTIFVLQGVFRDYNPDFEAQARSLGAGPLAVFWRVTLPLTLPGIAVAALFSFLLSWSQYLSTLIIGGGRTLTLPILLFALIDSGDRPVAAAVSLLFVLPALLALLAGAQALGRGNIEGVR